MVKALALIVKDLKDNTRVKSEELYANGHSRDIEFGYEGKYIFLNVDILMKAL